MKHIGYLEVFDVILLVSFNAERTFRGEVMGIAHTEGA
jgi:hypothetical protein